MGYNVLVVDDQRMSRQLFENILTGSGRYTVAASIRSAKVADAWCAKGGIDLILMDVVMADGYNGLEAAERIKRSYPQVKIVIVTSMPDPLFLRRARQIGVDSFWYKEVEDLPLLGVIDRTMAGEQVWPDRPPETKLGLALSTEFTDRELDVLRQLAEGMTDREIAERLHLSVPTVRYHVTNLISKTGLGSRTELAVIAVRSGLTLPGF